MKAAAPPLPMKAAAPPPPPPPSKRRKSQGAVPACTAGPGTGFRPLAGPPVPRSPETLVRIGHATPTWRPPWPWPLLTEPNHSSTDVAEQVSAEGALAAGPLGGPALCLRACDVDGLAGFA